MKPILCIIDLKESSAVVLKKAVELTGAFKTYLIVIFPYRLIPQVYTGNLSELKSKLEDDAIVEFATLMQQGDFVAHLCYEFRAEIGFTSDRITAYLKAGEAEMIVIGQQQAKAINELNHTALQDLIKSSKLPFTIVPETSSPPDLNC